MAEEHGKKTIVKKKIKLKVNPATDKAEVEKLKTDEVAGETAPVKHEAVKQNLSHDEVSKPKAEETKPSESTFRSRPQGHFAPRGERTNSFQNNNTSNNSRPPFRKPGDKPPFNNDRNRTGGGGFNRDRAGGPGQNRDRDGGRPPFNRGGGFKPAAPATGDVNEKEHSGKGKHRKVFVDKTKSKVDIKEKNKYREEEILLSKMEDSIRKRARKGEWAIPEVVDIGEVIKVSDLAKKMNLKAAEIIQKLIDLGVLATINDNIDSDTAAIVCSEFNCKVNVRSAKDEIEIKEEEDKENDLVNRSPVVTIMGHVDHGKTKLLDAIRNSSVAEHETGGITQHIGAYRVKTKSGEITFIDTPGHEAFTAMRARGANVTDIVILVVSAEEGVKPQTIEALNHAKLAKVPILVAVNKIDLPNSNLERVKQQLAEQGLQTEEWGGDVMFIPVSALKKTGIDDLLDRILLQAEVMDLKSNPKKRGVGYIIESKMDIGKGPIATVIVKNGCIKIGDDFVVGNTMGKVRGMFDDNGNKINIALPSYAVEVMGFNVVPEAGDKFYVVENDMVAKNITSKRLEYKKSEDSKSVKKMQMQNAIDKLTSGELTELKVIVKADVQGSVEAIKHTLMQLKNEAAKVNVISSGVGAVLESDVMLASAANSGNQGCMILAFRVRVDSIAKEKAESEGIIIKRFSIIYELTDYINSLLEGLIVPEIKEKIIGTAEIRDVFKIKDVGKIAGSYVTEGYIRKSDNVRVFREGKQVWDGKIKNLKRFQDDATEVQVGFECGISFTNFENMKKGDIVECYVREEVKK